MAPNERLTIMKVEECLDEDIENEDCSETDV